MRKPNVVDPSEEPSEVVRNAADDRIRQEAIRQLHSIDLDLDDDEARIEPLPEFESSGVFDDLEVEGQQPGNADIGDESTWDEVLGRFVPDSDTLN